MKWKDFFYYSEGDKRGILLLFILIVLLLGAHFLWNKHPAPSEKMGESDSLKQAFAQFQQTQMEEEKYERYHNYRQQRQEYADRYSRKDYNNSYEKYGSKNQENSKLSFPAYVKQEKLATGQTISINESDTSEWKKIPGIGSGFAGRIVKYRSRLGGFVSVDQLKEVYGVDEALFDKVRPFVKTDNNITKLKINQLTFDQLHSHPYLSFKQIKSIVDLRQRKGKINSIKTLEMLDEFSESDIKRLKPYLSFE